jgi:hypothetical protein
VYFGYKEVQAAEAARNPQLVSPRPDASASTVRGERIAPVTPQGGGGPASAGPVGVSTARVAEAPPPTDGVIYAPAVPRPTVSGDVVGIMLDRDVRLEPRPITFGQVFARGDLPRGASLVARIGGRQIPAQLDVKASHPDGSARMGVVTLVASAPASLMLARGAAPSGPGVELTAPPGLVVELTIGGARRSFDVAAALAAAVQAGSVSYWLRGPLVTEARIDVPVTGSLHLTFDIRSYADKSSMVDVQVRNDIIFQSDGATLNYDVTIRRGNDVVLRRQNLHHYLYQTWHWPVWSAGDPRVNVVHDAAYMMHTESVHHYDLTTGVAASVIAGEVHDMGSPEFDILGSAGITKYMPTTGGRGDIGPLTAANTIWLLTQHRDAARFALAQADGAGSVPWHFFDRPSNEWATATKYPLLWNDGRAVKDNMTQLTPVSDGASGWAPDDAHHPDLAYLPYLMTGTRYYLDQINAEATGMIANIWPFGRQAEKAIVTNGVMQIRARAWTLRDVNECAWINPNGSAMKVFCELSSRNSLDFLASEAKRLSKGEAHGWFSGPWNLPGVPGGIPPWQQDFVASTLILMAKQDVPGAKEIVRWQSNFLVGRFVAESKGFPPRHGTAYGLVVFAARDDEPFETWAQVNAETKRVGLAKDDATWASDDSAYSQAATGVLGGMVSVLGTAEAKRAWAWMRDNGLGNTAKVYQAYPTWHIVPGD